MKIDNFFSELKRRNVYKVAVAYAVVGWLLVQIATQVFPFLEIPNWVVRLVIALVAIGFPIALVIAWAFETTPEGIKPTEDVDPSAASRAPRKHAWIYVVVVGATLSAALFFLGRYTAGRTAAAAWPSSVAQKSIAVLPFLNLSADKNDEYLSDGMTEELLNVLTKVKSLRVQREKRGGHLSQGRRAIARHCRAGGQRAQSRRQAADYRSTHQCCRWL